MWLSSTKYRPHDMPIIMCMYRYMLDNHICNHVFNMTKIIVVM
jgi:hypothetical protein